MSPLLLRISFTASLLCSVSLRAEDATSAKPDAAAPAIAPYELKNRSSFNCTTDSGRAPFWPIGWVKRKGVTAGPAQVAQGPKILIDEKSFKVTSILLGSGTTPSLAVINGRAYSEGEFLRMPKGATPPVRIRVQRINDGNVTLQHADQTLVAALQRPELSARKSEELLIDQDR